MSDGQMRMLSSAVIAGAGGITVGLAAIGRSTVRRGSDDLTAIVVGVLMLLVGGIRWVSALR